MTGSVREETVGESFSSFPLLSLSSLPESFPCQGRLNEPSPAAFLISVAKLTFLYILIQTGRMRASKGKVSSVLICCKSSEKTRKQGKGRRRCQAFGSRSGLVVGIMVEQVPRVKSGRRVRTRPRAVLKPGSGGRLQVRTMVRVCTPGRSGSYEKQCQLVNTIAFNLLKENINRTK
uniref:Uncharacterized protein n=1 Tax=Terrapene triunguis TaxID=2587831 RepID=A0A674IQ54_9SAUR